MADAIKTEELGVLDFCDKIDGEAESAKRRVSRNWKENMGLLRGDGIWRAQRPPLFMMNLIRNQLEKKVAQVTDSRPSFTVRSRLKELMKAATVLDHSCRAILEAEEFWIQVERVAMFGAVLGCGFISVEWDPTALFGDGNIVFYCLDPRAVYVDPALTEPRLLSKEAAYVRIDYPRSLQWIRARYPGRGALVVPDDRLSKFPETKDQSGGVISSVLSYFPRVFRLGEPLKDGPIPRAMVSKYLVRDPDVSRWPLGREIVRAGNVLLSDSNNQYYDGRFHLEMIDWRMDLESPWGVDDVQDLKKIQEAFVRLGDAIMRNAIFNSQAWLIADMNSLDPESWKKVTAEGGLMVKKRAGTEFRRDPPPALPNYMFQVLMALPGLADLITGNSESMRPRGARSNTEAVLEGLQTAGSSLARMIARRYEGFVQRVGELVISRIIQFFTADRMLEYYDQGGDLISYFYERDKIFRNDAGQPVGTAEIERHFRQFRFFVQPMSSLAMTKMQRAQIALGLWQASAGKGYPFKRVLDLADIGDPDALMEEARKEQELGIVPMPSPPVKR